MNTSKTFIPEIDIPYLISASSNEYLSFDETEIEIHEYLSFDEVEIEVNTLKTQNTFPLRRMNIEFHSTRQK